jgi:hypothetical protein
MVIYLYSREICPYNNEIAPEITKTIFDKCDYFRLKCGFQFLLLHACNILNGNPFFSGIEARCNSAPLFLV